jgi:hypothetical protein
MKLGAVVWQAVGLIALLMPLAPQLCVIQRSAIPTASSRTRPATTPQLTLTSPSTKPRSASPPRTAVAVCLVLTIDSRRDARMGATERGEMTRQPIASDRLAGMNGEDAAFEIAQFGEDKLG